MDGKRYSMLNGTIRLFRPYIGNQFYTNPYILQRIAINILKSSFNSSNLDIIDGDCFDKKEPVSPVDLIILDTVEGFEHFISDPWNLHIINQSKKCILTGFIVDYGDTDLLCSIVSSNSKNLLVEAVPTKTLISNLSYFEKDKLTPNHVEKAYPKLFFENLKKRGDRLLVSGISSGCEHKCTFCILNSIKNEGPDSIGNDTNGILSAINTFHSKNIPIQFTDENFFSNCNEKRLNEIRALCSNLLKLKNINSIGIDTRCDAFSIDKQKNIFFQNTFDTFVKAGLDYVYLGIESISDKQIKRYGKRFKVKDVISSINFLREKNISFTVGLILIEPLAKKQDILQNIKFIEDNALHKNVASLLKESRLYINTPYTRCVFNKGLIKSKDGINLISYPSNDVIYIDDNIAESIQHIRNISNTFRRSGYRHSDIARAMSGKYSHIIEKIHSSVIKAEINILKGLIIEGTPSNIIYSELLESIKDIIQAIDDTSSQWQKKPFFKKVFLDIEKSLLMQNGVPQID